MNQENAIKQIMTHPDLWAEYYMKLEGKPKSLKEAPYWRPIYREFIDGDVVYTNKTIVLYCGHKVWKSEFAKDFIIYCATTIPFFNILYTCPRGQHVRRFVKQRLSPAVKDAYHGKNQLSLKEQFINPEATEMLRFRLPGYERENFVHCYSSWKNSDQIVDTTVDLVISDEHQSCSIDREQLFERVGQSKYKWKILMGTARYKDDPLHQAWELSDKKEWNVEKEIWEPKNPKGIFSGYHINQIICPTYSELDIMEKKQTSRPKMFANYVMGEPWTGSRKPLVPEDFYECRDKNRSYGEGAGKDNYGGIDWGETHTILIANENFEVFHYEQIDPEKVKIVNKDTGRAKEIQYLLELTEKYNVKWVADSDYGDSQCRTMQGFLQHKFRKCKFGAQNIKIKYIQREGGKRIYCFRVDKTKVHEDMIEKIQNHGISLPWKTNYDKEKSEEIIDQCCNIFSNIEDIREENKAYQGNPREKFGQEGTGAHAFMCLIYIDLSRSKKSHGFTVRTIAQ